METTVIDHFPLLTESSFECSIQSRLRELYAQKISCDGIVFLIINCVHILKLVTHAKV